MGHGQQTERDGTSHAAHRAQARKTADALGIAIAPEVQPYLEPAPDLPVEGFYLWQWFCELHARRSTGFGVNPISWSDLHAWAQLRRTQPTQWEQNLLLALDSAWLNAYGKQHKANKVTQ